MKQRTTKRKGNMTMTDGPLIGFVVAASCTLLGAVCLVLSRNLVYSIVALAVVCLGVAGVYALLGATFLALVHILMYAGTVCIMVVLSIMVTNQGGMGRTSLFNRNTLPACILAGLSAAITIPILYSFSAKAGPGIVSPPTAADDLAFMIFSRYVVAFELVGLMLLVALVGAIFLTRR